MKPVLTPVADLAPSTYNPRTADADRLDLLELSLRKLGWVLPVYATPDGEIVSGHQRHLIAQRIGWSEVPVVRLPAMELPDRKALNIVFNRATNDMPKASTTASLTERLYKLEVAKIAMGLPDAEDRYPCLQARMVKVRDLTKINAGRWERAAKSSARQLFAAGVEMPLVCLPDGIVVNGVGRLEHAAERGIERIAAVTISPEQHEFAAGVLNLLTMDFDIHTRYADELRFGSYQRPTWSRKIDWRAGEDRAGKPGLTRCFAFPIVGLKAARTFDLEDAEHVRRWKAKCGRRVLDFGSGQSMMRPTLESVGVAVDQFEPYYTGGTRTVDRPASVAIAREFLEAVREGVRWRTVFVSQVMNSVPFHEDRLRIVAIVAALTSHRLYASGRHVKAPAHTCAMGKEYLNSVNGGVATFQLDYEPNTIIGDVGLHPKVQRFHSDREFHELWRTGFGAVRVTSDRSQLFAECAQPLEVDRDRLAEALAFEFDLPYPDGERMGLAAEALDAFGERLGMRLQAARKRQARRVES